MRALTVLGLSFLATSACSKILDIDGDVTLRDPLDASETDAPIDGPPLPFQSCASLGATCGANSNVNCCQTVTIPGTVAGMPFYRSYDESIDNYNDMSFPATLTSFAMDTYEVTVGRFRAFVNAGKGTQQDPPAEGAGAHPKLPNSGWSSTWNTNLPVNKSALITAIKCNQTNWTDAVGANENKPMNCVNWYEAMAFCIADGGYLPTEAEWNYVASGGREQRSYPWSTPASSTAIDCTRANYKIDMPTGMHCVNGATGGTNQVGSESPTGDGRWGHADLAGNVWEWTLDYFTTAYLMPCDDCANLMPGTSRVLRGGGYFVIASSLRTAYRGFLSPANRDAGFGIRCARNP